MTSLPFRLANPPGLAGQVAGPAGLQIAGQIPGVFHPFPYPCYDPALIPVFYVPGHIQHSIATTAGSSAGVPSGNDTVKQSPLNGQIGSAVFPPPRSTLNSKSKAGSSIEQSSASSVAANASSPSPRQPLDYTQSSTSRKSSSHKSYHHRRDQYDYKRALADKWLTLQRKRSEVQRNKHLPKKTLTIPLDPRRWSPKDVQTWLFYTIHMNDIDDVDFADFSMNGKGLCLLPESAFIYRVPKPPSDPGGIILYRDLRLRLLRCVKAERAQRAMPPTLQRATNPPSRPTATDNPFARSHASHNRRSPSAPHSSRSTPDAHTLRASLKEHSMRGMQHLEHFPSRLPASPGGHHPGLAYAEPPILTPVSDHPLRLPPGDYPSRLRPAEHASRLPDEHPSTSRMTPVDYSYADHAPKLASLLHSSTLPPASGHSSSGSASQEPTSRLPHTEHSTKSPPPPPPLLPTEHSPRMTALFGPPSETPSVVADRSAKLMARQHHLNHHNSVMRTHFERAANSAHMNSTEIKLAPATSGPISSITHESLSRVPISAHASTTSDSIRCTTNTSPNAPVNLDIISERSSPAMPNIANDHSSSDPVAVVKQEESRVKNEQCSYSSKNQPPSPDAGLDLTRSENTEIPHSSSSPDPTPNSTQTDDNIRASEGVKIKVEPVDREDQDPPSVEEAPSSSGLVCTAEKDTKRPENDAFVNKIQSQYESHGDCKNV